MLKSHVFLLNKQLPLKIHGLQLLVSGDLNSNMLQHLAIPLLTLLIAEATGHRVTLIIVHIEFFLRLRVRLIFVVVGQREYQRVEILRRQEYV